MAHILICDDDPVFVRDLSQRVTDLARRLGEPLSLQTFTRPEALTQGLPGSPDIVFLDIDLGRTSGMDLARQLRRKGEKALLIFVTNYPEYAPEGYEVSAFRFLDKKHLDQKLPYYFSQALNLLHARRDLIHLDCREGQEVFPASRLVFAETHQRHLLLHMTGHSVPLLESMKTMGELEDLLAPYGFLRVHQSFLVNLQYLRKMQSTGVWLTTGEALPISARNYRSLKESLLIWRAQNPWNTF